MKVGLLAGLGVAVLSTVIGQAAAEIVVIVAALTAIGWVFSKIILPLAKVLGTLHKALPSLQGLAEFMAKTAEFMVETRTAVINAESAAEKAAAKTDRLDGRMDLLERHISLFAAEDAARIRQAMHSGPPDVERRRTP